MELHSVTTKGFQVIFSLLCMEELASCNYKVLGTHLTNATPLVKHDFNTTEFPVNPPKCVGLDFCFKNSCVCAYGHT